MFGVTNRVLSKEEVIELFEHLKTNDLKTTAEAFGVKYGHVKYQRKKYKAHNEEELDRAIRQIQRELDGQLRDFEKQEACDHVNAKVFLKCDCSLCIGESEPDRIIEILEKIKVSKVKNLIEVVL